MEILFMRVFVCVSLNRTQVLTISNLPVRKQYTKSILFWFFFLLYFMVIMATGKSINISNHKPSSSNR